MSRFLALGARFAVEVRIFLDVRFDGLLHRYDFECGEDILFGGILQRLHQRLVQFGLQRLLGGRTGHAQYDGREPHMPSVTTFSSQPLSRAESLGFWRSNASASDHTPRA